jgi:hypothetical protein
MHARSIGRDKPVDCRWRGECPDLNLSRRWGYRKQPSHSLPLYKSTPAGCGDCSVKLGLELFTNVIVTVDRTLTEVRPEDLRSLCEVVAGHQFPGWSGVPMLFGRHPTRPELPE